jgi:hypothetical protein
MIRPVLFICIFVLFFVIYYYSIEEYRRGVTEIATPKPNSPAPLVFAPCRGVYNWTVNNGQGSNNPVAESDAVCERVQCSGTITGIFQNKETDPNLMCSIPPNKTIVCPKCQNLAVSSCQFTSNTANSQIVKNNVQAQPILTSTDTAYAVDKGTVTAYQTAYNKYMDLINNCNSPPPFDTASNSFICPSTTTLATVNNDRIVICSS